MIQVVKRVFEILAVLREAGPLPLRDVADRVSLKKTTCHNILKSLSELGIVQCEGGGVYRIGGELRQLAAIPVSDEALVGLASTHIEGLAAKTGETVILAVLREASVRLLCASEGKRDIVVRSGAHKRGSLYRWATGRLLFAHEAEASRLAICNQLGPPSADDWPEMATAPGMMDGELASIRELEVLERAANIEGALSLASPIRRGDGRVVAALGLALPSFRAEERLAQVRRELARTAAVINRELAAL